MALEQDRRWIVSARYDVAMVAIPFAIAFGALFLVTGLGVQEPLWAYLLCFVAFDVAHVWATAFLTYLDGEAFRRRRALYLWPLPIFFTLSFGLHLFSPSAFWTALAYFAIFHFAKQQYGFVAIYKAKAQEREKRDFRLDKLALWTGVLGPVLLWHATPAGQFDWFDGGERFLVRLPDAARPLVYGAMLVVGSAWAVRQAQLYARSGHLNAGKLLWMSATWVSWFIGVRMTDHLLISAAFLNVLHGMPFLMLVWHRLRSRYASGEGARVQTFVARMTRSNAWPLFYGGLFAIGVVEEALWDGVVWRTYLPGLMSGSWPEVSAVAMSFWVALLSLPQVVHYFLDGFLWKLDRHNEDLRAALGLVRR